MSRKLRIEREGSAPPALVLGSGITALGTLRCLGRAGIRAYYAADQRDFSATSRFARVVPTGLGPFSGSDELGAALASLDVDEMVLIPCSDAWARAVAGLDPAISARFHASVAKPEQLDLLADKLKFYDLMKARGIEHPTTVAIDSATDLERLPDASFEASFLKPRSSQHFAAKFKTKAFRVATRADAIARFAQIDAAGLSVVLQQYVPGPPTNHFYVDTFVDRRGRTVTRFPRQRLRMSSDFADSSLLRSIPMENVRAREACAVMDRIVEALAPVRGMLSAELKLDPRDGRLKIIEVNARAWKHVEFAATSGVDIVRLAYEDALGIESAPITAYRDDATCADLYHDLPGCWRLYKADALSLGEWIGSLWGASGPVIAIDDPVPAVARFRALIAESLERRVGRVVTRS